MTQFEKAINELEFKQNLEYTPTILQEDTFSMKNDSFMV